MKKILTLSLLVASIAGYPQGKKKAGEENQQALKEFITVCNTYKQFPLHLSIQQSGTATFPSDEDTMTTIADFFLTPSGAYIRYGDTEQLINDSLMLMVSNDQKVMMIYGTKNNMQTQLEKYLGFQHSASSLEKMEKQYKAAISLIDKNISAVELKNLLPLPGTDLVKESITVKYYTESKEPIEVSYMRKSLILIDSSDMEELKGIDSIKTKLVSVGNDHFLINERIKTYRYNQISHKAIVRLPALVSDRIIRKTDGSFLPAKGFEDYYISVD